MQRKSQPARQGRGSHLLAPFQRITSSGRFIPEIDGLRFVAILFVFLFHLAGTVATNSPSEQISSIRSGTLNQIANTLDIGVPLFFVISGFILGLPFAESLTQHKSFTLKRYFLRRVTRLEPPYILCLVLSLMIKLVSGRGLTIFLSHFLASVLYCHNVIYGYQSTITAVAWSLEIEIQFYVLAPLLSSVFLIRSKTLRRAALCIAIVAATAVSEYVKNDPRLHLSLLGFAQFFLVGLLLTDLYLSALNCTSWKWDLLSLLGWPFLILLRWKAPLISAWVAPWTMLALYVASLAGVFFQRCLSLPVITTIGGMCYSIYLLHNQLIYGFALLTKHVLSTSSYSIRLLTQFLLIGPAVLLVAAAYFVFIERPCMAQDWPRLVKRVVSRRVNANGIRLGVSPASVSIEPGKE